MSAKIPNDVRTKVKEAVFRLADEFSYMKKSRTDNGIFMENLIKYPEVGEVLAQYMSKGTVKTYIKDAILNRYMKDKKSEVLSGSASDILPVVKKMYGCDVLLIEKYRQLFIFRLDNGEVLVVSQGTFLKWETALRKVLEFIAGTLLQSSSEEKIRMLLNIAVLGAPSTSADRDQLRRALGRIGVEINFADCGD
jgi:hypothetical protein